MPRLFGDTAHPMSKKAEKKRLKEAKAALQRRKEGKSYQEVPVTLPPGLKPKPPQ